MIEEAHHRCGLPHSAGAFKQTDGRASMKPQNSLRRAGLFQDFLIGIEIDVKDANDFPDQFIVLITLRFQYVDCREYVETVSQPPFLMVFEKSLHSFPLARLPNPLEQLPDTERNLGRMACAELAGALAPSQFHFRLTRKHGRLTMTSQKNNMQFALRHSCAAFWPLRDFADNYNHPALRSGYTALQRTNWRTG
jgi:hypothetical protein